MINFVIKSIMSQIDYFLDKYFSTLAPNLWFQND
jgi:hypothetical protein